MLKCPKDLLVSITSINSLDLTSEANLMSSWPLKFGLFTAFASTSMFLMDFPKSTSLFLQRKDNKALNSVFDQHPPPPLLFHLKTIHFLGGKHSYDHPLEEVGIFWSSDSGLSKSSNLSVFGLPLDSSSGGALPVGKQPKKRENLGQSHVDSFWQTVNDNGKTTFFNRKYIHIKKGPCSHCHGYWSVKRNYLPCFIHLAIKISTHNSSLDS